MNNQQVSQLIDRIIYLFSLAARKQDIEPFKDTLSMVTARWDHGKDMVETDQNRLTELEDQIKMYLVTQDPLRSFTLESLEKRLNTASDRQFSPKISAFGTITVLSLCGGLLAFAASAWLDVQDRALLCVALFFLSLHVGIAWLYISALKNFRSAFRQTYVYLSTSAVVLSVGFSQYVFINLFELDRYLVFQYAGITWLIGLPFLLMYLGLRLYAKLLQVKSMFTSLTLAACIMLTIAILLTVLPRPDVQSPLYFHTWSLGVWAIPVFALLSSVLANKIRKVVTPAYARSMDWLYYYTLVVGLGSMLSNGFMYASGELYGERLAAVIALCGIAPQMVLLYAAFSFKRETSK